MEFDSNSSVYFHKFKLIYFGNELRHVPAGTDSNV